MHRLVTEKSRRCISSFPGCEDVCISHDAMLFIDYRGNGNGHNEHKRGLEEMKKLGYDYALCLVRSDNYPQHKILKKAGWKVLSSVTTKGCDFYELYGRSIY